MELKEAISELEMYRANNSNFDEELAEAIDVVLETLENSIPKEKIENELEQIRIEHNTRLEKCKSIEEKNIVTSQYNSMRCILEDILEGEND